MKTLKFKNGDILPPIGLGTWLSQTNEVYDAVLEAIRLGYRHFDCAYIYKNEVEVGLALDYAFRYGIVKREELFVTSKLWNGDHDPSRVELAINRSLSNLQLKQLDLYLIHWPIAYASGKDEADSADDLIPLEQMPLEDTWDAMGVLKEKGLARHIGVSNFNIPKLENLMKKTKWHPEVNQVELHPFLQQDELVTYCHKKNILLTAYSPLGSQRLINSKEGIDSQEIILSIAQKHACTPAQVMLAWGMQRGTSVIPKSVNKERIQENLDALKVNLDDKDMEQIKTLNKNHRQAKALFALLPGGPYTEEWLWNE